MTKPKTKLIWTVTHAGMEKTGVDALVSMLVENNIDAVRLVYSSSTRDGIRLLREKIDERLSQSGQNPGQSSLPFLLELVGRRAVLCVPNGEITLQDGEQIEVTFTVDFNFCASYETQNTNSQQINVVVSAVDQLHGLKAGAPLVFAYGSVELVIERIEDNGQGLTAQCLVVSGGRLYSGGHVHSKDISRDFFPLLPQDKESLGQDLTDLADFLIIHGITSEDQFLTVKRHMIGNDIGVSERHPTIAITDSLFEAEASLPPRFLLKVDSKFSLELMPNLMKKIDGVFLSRSELGIDEHPHELAIIQKKVIAQCNHNAKIVIVASELMDSMRFNANPTRAEVSDMANAAADGADALLLSSEVSEGPNAHLAAQVSSETLLASETWLESAWSPVPSGDSLKDDDLVTYGAICCAKQADAKAIVCYTEGGYTAVKLSSLHTPVSIIAITCNKKIMRQMSILHSVTPVLLGTKSKTELLLSEAKNILMQKFGFSFGQRFVFVSLTASSVARRNSNLFTVQEV